MDEHQDGEVTKETSSNENSSTKGQETGSKKTIISILIVIILIFGALEFSGTTDILGVDKVLAIVNGEKITQTEFDVRFGQITSNPQAASIDLDNPEIRSQIEKQVLDEIINTRLLLQAATDSGFTTTDEEVQVEYDLIVDGFGGTEALMEELQKVGITEETLRKNLSEQLLIEQYINEKTEAGSIVVTSEEIDAFYDQISGQEGAPPLFDVQTQIERQLISEKQQQIVSELVAILRAEADIEITEQDVEETEITEDVVEDVETTEDVVEETETPADTSGETEK